MSCLVTRPNLQFFPAPSRFPTPIGISCLSNNHNTTHNGCQVLSAYNVPGTALCAYPVTPRWKHYGESALHAWGSGEATGRAKSLLREADKFPPNPVSRRWQSQQGAQAVFSPASGGTFWGLDAAPLCGSSTHETRRLRGSLRRRKSGTAGLGADGGRVPSLPLHDSSPTSGKSQCPHPGRRGREGAGTASGEGRVRLCIGWSALKGSQLPQSEEESAFRWGLCVSAQD